MGLKKVYVIIASSIAVLGLIATVVVYGYVNEIRDYEASVSIETLYLSVAAKDVKLENVTNIKPVTTTSMIGGKVTTTTTTILVNETKATHITTLESVDGTRYISTDNMLYDNILEGDTIEIDVRENKEKDKTYYVYKDSRIDLSKQ